MSACNADVGHPCDANDGEPCASCAEWLAREEREHRQSYAVATMLEREPQRCEREMRDAGRGGQVR
jgi:hypothetical protein